LFEVYSYFLIRITITTPTMTIAMIMAIVEDAKYMSFDGIVVTGYGACVGAASVTVNDVSACEG